jgi:hypothetical protein
MYILFKPNPEALFSFDRSDRGNSRKAQARTQPAVAHHNFALHQGGATQTQL